MSRAKDALHRANPSTRQRPSKGPGATWRPENHDHLFPQGQEARAHMPQFSQAKYVTEHVSSGLTAGEDKTCQRGPHGAPGAPAHFPQAARQTGPADIPRGEGATTPGNRYSALCVETPRTTPRHEHWPEQTQQKHPLLAACPQPAVGRSDRRASVSRLPAGVSREAHAAGEGFTAGRAAGAQGGAKAALC